MDQEGFRESVTFHKRASGRGCGNGGKNVGWLGNLPFAGSKGMGFR